MITSLSPCLLAVLPAIVGYIGGYGTTRQRGLLLSTAFVFGTAVTFAGLGIAAALLGGLFGPVGRSWQYLLAAVSFGMGLNLLGFLPFHFPTLTRLPEIRRGAGGAFVLGLLFGLVASPCATPVLAVFDCFLASAGAKPSSAGCCLRLTASGMAYRCCCAERARRRWRACRPYGDTVLI